MLACLLELLKFWLCDIGYEHWRPQFDWASYPTDESKIHDITPPSLAAFYKQIALLFVINSFQTSLQSILNQAKIDI